MVRRVLRGPDARPGWGLEGDLRRRSSALICAPTGSGKTLASFLWGIDRLTREPQREEGVRIVYVSPLKALSYDIERNLRAPLRGIGSDISVGLRTGDTPQKERQAMRRTPPDILITTPESLYLMLSSGAREILATTEAVIVDEIHAVAQIKRGSHLALTLERLEWLARKHREAEGLEVPEGPVVQRIGLSATQRPLERIAQFLVGPKRACEIVDAGRRKPLDLEIVVPVDDMADPGQQASGGGPVGSAPASGKASTGPTIPRHPPERRPRRRVRGIRGLRSTRSPKGPQDRARAPNFDGATNPRSIWPAIYPELLALVRQHTSTIVFVNNRRGSERLAKRLNELAYEEVDGGPRRRRAGALQPRSTRSRGRTTGPSRTRSGRSSRSC